jgi:hypothetical protein
MGDRDVLILQVRLDPDPSVIRAYMKGWQIAAARESAYHTSETNGDDARRSACSELPKNLPALADEVIE